MSFKILQQVILLAIGLGLIFFYIQPRLAEMRVLQEEVDEYSRAVDNATQYNQALGQLINQVNAFSRADIRAIERFLPLTTDKVAVARDIEFMALQNNVIVRDITVTENELSGFGEVENVQRINDDPFASETGVREPREVINPQADIKTHSVTVSVTSDYDSFKRFLQAIEANAYPLYIAQFTIVTNEDGGERVSDLLTYDLTLLTFSQNHSL